MSRNPQYRFISTDPTELEAQLTAGWEALCGKTVMPASPERLFIQWVCAVVIQERVLNNYTGNQNIPSRAEKENLDALGALFYAKERPGKKTAGCTMEFWISEVQTAAVTVPKGTRITDTEGRLVWETREDALIEAGQLRTAVKAVCKTPGKAGNGYIAGQICVAVDSFEYYAGCANTTTSDGGADEPDDEEYYELLRASMDAYSTAGSTGGYVYWAKQVSTQILDVVANSPSPGVVYLYALMKSGEPAGEEIKQRMLEACSGEKVRAFTDDVHAADAEIVRYNIDLTYYMEENTGVSATQIRQGVDEAVEKFARWQREKLGRDINPSKLHRMLMDVAGVKRVDIRAPVFTVLKDGRMTMGTMETELSQTVPQLAKVGTINIRNGGYEHE